MIRLLISHVKPLTSSLTVRTLPQIVNLVKSSPFIRNFASAPTKKASVNLKSSELAKDVIVYTYDNPRFFKLMNIFALSQFGFWAYLGHWSYTSLRNVAIPEEVQNDENAAWFRKVNFGEDKYKAIMASGCFVVAYLVLFVAWTFILRSVRYLVYSKNGKDVSFVTYTPFGKNRILTVPIRNISAEESRQTAKTFLPLKIKNRKLFYVLDMKGEFNNKTLYDREIGLRRNL